MFMNVTNMIKRAISNERGQGMVEYALILVGIALVVIVAAKALGADVTALFNSIGDTVNPPASS